LGWVVIIILVVVVVTTTGVTRSTSPAATSTTKLGAFASHARLIAWVGSGALSLRSGRARVQNVSHDPHELRVGGAEKPRGVVFDGEAHVR